MTRYVTYHTGLLSAVAATIYRVDTRAYVFLGAVDEVIIDGVVDGIKWWACPNDFTKIIRETIKANPQLVKRGP